MRWHGPSPSPACVFLEELVLLLTLISIPFAKSNLSENGTEVGPGEAGMVWVKFALEQNPQRSIGGHTSTCSC